MEDIFDNLLYIVIVLASFIISALGKKKKKQQRPTTMSKPKVTPGNSEPRATNNFNLEALLKEQMGIQEEDFYEAEPEQETIFNAENNKKEEKPLDRVPEYMLDDKEDISYSVEYDTKESEISDEFFNEDQNEEILTEKSLSEEFDLQQAVIYSEILNRKEY